MTTVTTPSAGPASPPDPHGDPADRRATRIVWWSFACFVALRALVVAAASTPAITPDELGSWAVAKELVGSAAMTMQGTPRYSLLSGAVLAPVEALGLGGDAAYRLALVLLSALLVVAALLVRRAVVLMRPDRPVLAAAAWAMTLLFPATLATASFTWAEPVVALWWALLLWGVVASFVAHDPGARTVTCVVAGASVAVHGRLALVPVIWVLALVVEAALQRRRDGAGGRAVRAVMEVGLTAATSAVLLAIDHRVSARVWQGEVADVELGLAPHTGQWWLGLATATAGRVWYLVIASAGLAVLGAFGLWVTVRRPGPAGHRLAAMTLGLLLSSNVAIATLQGAGLLSDLDWMGPFGGLRWDHLLYGRYVDGPLLVLCVLGLVAASELVGRRAATVLLGSGAAAAVVAATIVALRRPDAELGPSIDVMMAGTSWMPLGVDRLAMAGWTTIGVVAVIVAAVALRRSWTTFLVALLVWFGAGAVLGTLETTLEHRRNLPTDLVAEIGPAPRPGSPAIIAADVVDSPAWRLGVYAQQRDLVDAGWSVTVADVDSARIAARPGRARLLALGEDATPPGRGWTAVGELGTATLWRLDRADG